MTGDPKPPTAKESDIIVVDLGSKDRKQIKRLRKGQGKLMDRVKQVVAEMKATGTVGHMVMPIVIVVEEERSTMDMMDMFGMMGR